MLLGGLLAHSPHSLSAPDTGALSLTAHQQRATRLGSHVPLGVLSAERLKLWDLAPFGKFAEAQRIGHASSFGMGMPGGMGVCAAVPFCLRFFSLLGALAPCSGVPILGTFRRMPTANAEG